jgi:uncharacterized damage-inducible protein DinB
MSIEQDAFTTDLHDYLQESREALLWKLDGLSERELRWPRTPTGTNLLGIVKHMAGVESGYFGEVFGRPWPHPELTGEDELEHDPQADWYATEDQTAAGVIDLYRQVWVFADATISELPLDAPGWVPWWPADRAPLTLHRVLVHVLTDLSRHVGQADVLREGIDGAAGMLANNSNIPDEVDYPAYVEKLQAIAKKF